VAPSAQTVDGPFWVRAEKVDPRVPWLYGFKVDYRFR
jgi:hypothetical protein